MTRVAEAVGRFAAEIAAASAALGRTVVVDQAKVADRSDYLYLKPPGVWSSNRSCRMVRAADGWIVVNLPREWDRQLVPAWLGARPDAEPWAAIARAARRRPWGELVEGARLLGMPVAGVGEVKADSPSARLHRLAAGVERAPTAALKVIDLSSLWAGPLCGALLAQAGAAVTKIESRQRPDAMRSASPDFFDRLNGEKAHAVVDFGSPAALAGLGERIADVDVLITSARPRAFEQLGLAPATLFARNPRLTWVAVTGHGWMGKDADRVAFGDDAAAAGGLVRWSARGEPRFLGDALADPLTGLAAAAGALKAAALGGGFLVDAGMAPISAGVAAAFQ